MSQFPQTVIHRDPATRLVRYDFAAYKPHLPHRWIGSLERYFNDGIEPGGFIRAVLENDFQGAIRRCDANDPVGQLQGLLDLLSEGAPASAWGSKAVVNRWLHEHVPKLGTLVPKGEGPVVSGWEVVSNASELDQAGQNLLHAAQSYWTVYQSEVAPDAVVWVENDNTGHLVIFSRGEYKERLLASIPGDATTPKREVL